MPGACEQRVGETLLRVFLEQRRGQPQRLETPDEPANLARVSGPPRVIGSRARPMVEVQDRLRHQVYEGIVKEPDQGIVIWIGKRDFRPMLFPPLHVPPAPRRYASDNYPPVNRIFVRRTCHPVEK